MTTAKRRYNQDADIVVISTTGDMYVPLVQRHLEKPIVFIDPQRLQRDATMTFDFRDGKQIVTFAGRRLSKVKSVWLRKPMSIESSKLPIAAPYRDYAFKSLEKFHAMLYTAFEDALWLPDFYTSQAANDKARQINNAIKLGFNVPDTIFTSDADVATNFIATHGSAIMKTLVHFNVEVDGVRKVMYSTKVTAQHPPQLNTLSYSPAIFQAVIDPAYDVRVTVVGHKVFAAKITTPGIDTTMPARDWRRGHFEGELVIEPDANFTDKHADLCRQHVKSLNMLYGAIDLVVDKQGVYWFLENNPNGQWGFVERLAGLPISKAVAELLDKGVS